jgi:hypothetical protein
VSRKCKCGRDVHTEVWDDREWCAGCEQLPGDCKCKPKGAGGPSQANLLLQLADRGAYWFGTSTRGEPFGCAEGESIVRPLRGGRGSIRAELARMFAEEHGKAPSANALADTMLALEGQAYAGEERDLHLRVARTAEAVWVDLGNADGDLARITAAGWEIVSGGGPLFRRTRLTGALPKPAPSGDISALRALLRVDDDAWPLIAAWLASILLLPGQPVPVLALTGEQGTAKSWQSRLLVQLADPSDSPLRTAPRDVESWAVAASASRVVALDNVSRIEPWLSDCLCRAVTGDGLVRRALYTDSDVSVIAFRRAVLINGISLTGLRGDLADRLIRVELEQLPDTERLDEADLGAKWEQAHPAVLGGLFNLAVAVLSALPGVQLERRPRMADYARILAAVDKVLETAGLENYLGQREQIAAEVVEDDAVATAIAAMAAKLAEPWEGTAKDLLALLRPPDETAEGWPKNGRGMTARITRAAPALRATGTGIELLPNPGVKRQAQRWRITGEQIAGERPQRPNAPADDESAGQDAGEPGNIEGTPGEATSQRPLNVPTISAGRDVGDVGDIPPPPLSPAVCDRCGEPHHRYGDGGRPCRTVPAEVGR